MLSQAFRRFSPTKFCCLLAIVSLTLFVAVQRADAGEDYYKQACEKYEKGDYEGARHLFMHINKYAPTYAPAHYQLGNTLLKLNRLAEAKASYELCMQHTKDPALIKNCQTAVQHILTEGPKRAQAASVVGKAAAQLDARASRDRARFERYQAAVAEVEKQRNSILNEARERVRKIKEDEERHVKEAEGSTNQRLRNVVTGERRVGLSDDQEAEIRAPYQQEAQKIMRIAEDRARVIRMPSVPTYEGTPPTAEDRKPGNDDDDDE